MIKPYSLIHINFLYIAYTVVCTVNTLYVTTVVVYSTAYKYNVLVRILRLLTALQYGKARFRGVPQLGTVTVLRSAHVL